MDAAAVSQLVEEEIALIERPELAEAIRASLVLPRLESREWDYGEEGQTYPCWIVVEHKESNTGIAYCEQGFGPSSPWGLLVLEGPHRNMGTDAAWFRFLGDAVQESAVWNGDSPPDFEVR
ncbi:hypothetical protein [Denitrobaculum tricleocarpae]|uniref:Uncharacterized protein n=1 Tax=Denitrobaculum tricleocarpae TaxID=2591009 RepID=A0A545U2A5_9PROT|nr:hypothetical protein [Denitrobaculum tricleocarpae]TQV83609.1 hypothetical protein FKG95_03185 [Denitrobaculum tricleocarpae]